MRMKSEADDPYVCWYPYCNAQSSDGHVSHPWDLSGPQGLALIYYPNQTHMH